MKNRNDSDRLLAAASQYGKEKEYWLDKLSGNLEFSHFPYDYTNEITGRLMDTVTFDIPVSISARIMKMADGSDYRLHMLLAVGSVMLLNKYTSNKDILVGVPIYKQEIEGEFTNTVLALRNQLNSHMTFKELLLQFRQTITEASQNSNYPIETLLYQLGMSMSDHKFPLFDVIILLENIHDKNYIKHIHNSVIFCFRRANQQFEGKLEYNSLLYNRSTIERIINHFNNLLLKSLFQADAKLSDLDILPDTERRQLLIEFNDNREEFPGDKTTYQWIEKHAKNSPDRIAISFNGNNLNYRTLNERANKLASILKIKGIQKDQLVGVLLKRSPLMVESILAAWRAGGAYIPLDTAYPPERIITVLKDSCAAVLLTKVKYTNSDITDSYEGCTIMLDRELKDLPKENKNNLGVEADLNSLAYVIYTSGSTGKPKGVMIEHMGMMNHIWAKINDLQLTGNSIIAQNSIHTFDISVWQFFAALILGGKTNIYPDQCVLDLETFLSSVSKDQVTILEVVPSYLSVILDYLDTHHTVPLSLNYLLVTGEEIKLDLIKKWFEKYPGIKMVNAYGPTEASDDITHYIMDKAPERTRVPIGKPVQNFNIYILDEDMNLCPPGIKGEIWVSGIGVGRGYLNNPGHTEDFFIEDIFVSPMTNESSSSFTNDRSPKLSPNDWFASPHSPHSPYSTIYRTGDLGCWLPDGTIDFFGRKDNQVKIRGYRIELGEIECKLSTHPLIKEAVVIDRDDEQGNKYLCAYLVMARDGESDVSEIKEWLLESVPDYMLPAHFIPLEQIPLTPGGKVDRKLLEALDIGVIQDQGYEAPRNPVEKKLLEMWQELLGIEKNKISIGANFFDLGGHSLKTMILTSKIHKEFSVKLSLEQIFEDPTIKGLWENIKKAGEYTFIPIDPAEKREYFASSTAQKRLYFIQQFELTGTAYNIPQILLVSGELNIERFEKSFIKLIERHEGLRTSFEIIDDEPVQKVHDELEFEIKYYEATNLHRQTQTILAAEDTEGEGIHHSSFIIHHFIRPFDLTRSPLLRVGLMPIENKKYLLMVDMHHIISDGVSSTILIQDFIALYKKEKLPSLKLQYHDYSQWQNSNEQQKALEKQKDYWLKTFTREIPVLNIQSDYPRPRVQSFDGNKVNFEIDKEKTGSLYNLAGKENATLFTVLLAVFNILLSKITSQEDIVVGTPVAGRRHADLERIIGLFINTLGLRNFPEGEITFRDFLHNMKENTLEAFENQDYPFEELVEKVPIERDVSRNPLFDVMFILQNIDFPQIEIPGLKLMPYKYENNTSKFDLTLASVEIEEKLLFTFEYCTKLFKQETIERFISYFKKIIASILVNPGIKISEIEIISGKEKKQILFDFNDTDAEYPQDKTIHELFEEQVERTPDNVALVGKKEGWKGRRVEGKKEEDPCGQVLNAFGENSLRAESQELIAITYKELNEKSNHLAHILQAKNVKPDTIVGIMMERSVEMIIGILGILKAGGAYLPIDPGYPGERIDYMLSDSKAKVLVTTRILFEDRKMGRWEDKKNLEIVILDFSTLLPFYTSTLPSFHLHLSLSYVIYTSGSTGKPKGTPVTHRNVNIYSTWFKREFQIGGEDKFCFAGSFCFDMSVTTLIVPLISGASLYTAREKIERDPQVYIRFLAENRVSIVKLTPTQFRPLQDFIQDEDLGSLRYIILGGEAVDVNDIRHYLSIYHHQRIVNEYGPTEATVATVFHVVSGNDFDGTVGYEPTRSSLPIGRPVSNARIYILDKYTNLVPPGVVGELCISGESVVLGYLNKPELTAEKFDHDLWDYQDYRGKRKKVPGKNKSCIHASMQHHYPSPQHPITPLPHSPIYRTGDLARWLPDGNIEYLGRIDNQVKVRGYRIELEEIEAVLSAHKGVNTGVAAVKNDPAGSGVLVAYVVPGQGETTTKIREYLENRLPAYMVPSLLVTVDELPVTASGKIDRKKLPQLSGLQPTGREAYREPTGEKERILADIWKGVLGINSVGIDDNFFQLGGDSIKAIQVVSRLQKYKYTLKISDLFLHPTVKQLTKYMKKLEKEIDQRPVQGEVELTPIQEWFFEKYFINSNNNFTALQHYNQSVMIYRREGFDRETVEQVSRGILLHHDALRIVYSLKKGKVVQRNRGLEGKLFELETMDLQDAADINTNIEIEIQRAANRLQQGMDLLNGPLVRLGLFKTNQGDHLLIAIHHLVVDGVSWRILLEDFSIGYQQAVNHQPVKFQEKTDSFQYWVAKLKEYAETPAALKELEYWKTLKETGTGELPVDHPLPAGQSDRKKRLNREVVTMELPETETVKLLRKVNRAYRTENNDILLAALGLGIKEWGGLNRVSIHLEGHGREEILEDVSVSRTVGWFTTLFPVVLDLTRTTELSYFIKQVKETLRQIPRRGIGYGVLRYLTGGNIEEITVEPGISFNYLGEFSQDHHANSHIFEFSPIKTGDNINPQLKELYQLDINGMVVSGKLVLSFGYNKYEYERHTIERLVESYRSNLEKIIEHCMCKSQVELTPSDLDYSVIKIDQLSGLENKFREKNLIIKNIYRLSPMQSGIFYHYLMNKDASWYFEQYEISLRGEIDRNLLEKSFNILLEQFDILRTVFVYEDFTEPVQIVIERLNAEVKFMDVSHLQGDAPDTHIKTFKQKDRAAGFDLSSDLLIRIALLKTGIDSYKVIWSFHHIIMDGWCMGIIFKYLVRIYTALLEKQPVTLESVKPYREFIKWLEEQDKEEAMDFWIKYLEGYENTAELPKYSKPGTEGECKNERYRFDIDEELTHKLVMLANENQVTLNTVVQTLWGILLQKVNKIDDVVFGTVVSGRPQEIEDVENMVGLFINTVPIRIKWGEGIRTFRELIRNVQQELLLSKSYEYLSLAEIESCSPLKDKLVDHIVVFENYPVQQELRMFSGPNPAGFEILDINVFEQNNYDFSMLVAPGETIEIVFSYHADVYGTALVKKIASYFTEMVKQVTDTPDIEVEKIELISPTSNKAGELQLVKSNILKEDQGDFGF